MPVPVAFASPAPFPRHRRSRSPPTPPAAFHASATRRKPRPRPPPRPTSKPRRRPLPPRPAPPQAAPPKPRARKPSPRLDRLLRDLRRLSVFLHTFTRPRSVARSRAGAGAARAYVAARGAAARAAERASIRAAALAARLAPPRTHGWRALRAFQWQLPAPDAGRRARWVAGVQRYVRGDAVLEGGWRAGVAAVAAVLGAVEAGVRGLRGGVGRRALEAGVAGLRVWGGAAGRVVGTRVVEKGAKVLRGVPGVAAAEGWRTPERRYLHSAQSNGVVKKRYYHSGETGKLLGEEENLVVLDKPAATDKSAATEISAATEKFAATEKPAATENPATASPPQIKSQSRDAQQAASPGGSRSAEARLPSLSPVLRAKLSALLLQLRAASTGSASSADHSVATPHLARNGAMVLCAGVAASTLAGAPVAALLSVSAMGVTALGARDGLPGRWRGRAAAQRMFRRSAAGQRLERAAAGAGGTVRGGARVARRADAPVQWERSKDVETKAYQVGVTQHGLLGVPVVGGVLGALDEVAFRVEQVVGTVWRRVGGMRVAGWRVLRSFEGQFELEMDKADVRPS